MCELCQKRCCRTHEGAKTNGAKENAEKLPDCSQERLHLEWSSTIRGKDAVVIDGSEMNEITEIELI